jgi:hypothetical protein
MFIALTILMTALSVALVLRVAGREPHSREGVNETFRYPVVFRRLLFLGIPIFSLFGAYAVTTIPPGKSHSGETLIVGIGFGAAILAIALSFVWMCRFSALVSENTLIVQQMWRTRTIPFVDVRKMVVLQGFKGSRDLALFDSQGRRVFTVGGSIQDFDDMVHLLKRRFSHRGVVFRLRDVLGKWSEHEL